MTGKSQGTPNVSIKYKDVKTKKEPHAMLFLFIKWKICPSMGIESHLKEPHDAIHVNSCH